MNSDTDFQIKKGIIIRYYLCAGILCFITGWLFYRNAVVAMLMSVFPFVFRKHFERIIRERMKERINVEFKDVLYAFSDTAASGRQADSAVFAAYRNLESIYGAGSFLTAEFAKMQNKIREANVSPEKALLDFGIKSGVEDIRNFMEIFCICIRAGGNREKAINKAALIIGDKIGLRQELNNLLIQKKLEAVILCTIPLIILGFMQITSSDYAEVLYSGVAGRIVMSFCLCAAAFAGKLCLNIMEIKI